MTTLSFWPNSAGQAPPEPPALACEAPIAQLDELGLGWFEVPLYVGAGELASFKLTIISGAGDRVSRDSNGLRPEWDEESNALAADAELMKELGEAEEDIANGRTVSGAELRRRG